jgi:phage gp29-like protein
LIRRFIERHGLTKYRLEPVPAEHFVRPSYYCPWEYCAAASSGTTTGIPLPPDGWVIRDYEAPVGRIAARLHVIRGMTLADWQGFLAVFGIPGIVVIMPDGIAPEAVADFTSIAEKIANNARGALPSGSTVETITQPTNGTAPFLELADWCDKQLVLAGTGGLLTMLAESGSGTLAGGAHMQAFQTLAKEEAADISEIIQDQSDALLLAHRFPGQPQYAYFKLASTEQSDPNQIVQHYTALKAAGLTIKQSELEEKTSYQFEEPAPVTIQNNTAPAPQPVPPLNPQPSTLNSAPADPLQAARKPLAAALNSDFSALRTLLQRIDALPEGDPARLPLIEAADSALTALLTADPGTTALDAAFESFAAEGLLTGWGLDDRQNTVN